MSRRARERGAPRTAPPLDPTAAPGPSPKGYAKVIPQMVRGAAARIADAVRGAGMTEGERYEEAARKLRQDAEGIPSDEAAPGGAGRGAGPADVPAGEARGEGPAGKRGGGGAAGGA
jgi:hypothetical protein